MTLRRELESLRGGSPHPGLDYRALRALARGVVSRLRRQGDSADDLVNTLLLGLVGRNDKLDALLALDEEGLEAATRNRLRQVAVEAAPRWGLVRSLTRHVAAVLTRLPPAQDHPPPSLQGGPGARLSRARVAEAAAWVLSQPNAPPRTPREVTATLLRHYYPRSVALQSVRSPVSSRTDPETAALRERSVHHLGHALRARLEDSKLEVLLRRLEGETFTKIAQDLGVGVATAHAWYNQAALVLRELVLERGGTPSTLRALIARALAKRHAPD